MNAPNWRPVVDCWPVSGSAADGMAVFSKFALKFVTATWPPRIMPSQPIGAGAPTKRELKSGMSADCAADKPGRDRTAAAATRRKISAYEVIEAPPDADADFMRGQILQRHRAAGVAF